MGGNALNKVIAVPKRKLARKRFWVFIAIAALIFIATVVIIFLVSSLRNNPQRMVLSSSEVPETYSLSTQGYKDINYWGNDTLLQKAKDIGFLGGYYRSFSYKAPSSVYYIISSVSIYKDRIKTSFDSFKSTLKNGGCEQVEVSQIGDGSFGCILNENTNQTSLNDSSATAIINRKHYDIVFYKKNVLAFVSVVQVSVGKDSSTDNLSGDASEYALDIANRI